MHVYMHVRTCERTHVRACARGRSRTVLANVRERKYTIAIDMAISAYKRDYDLRLKLSVYSTYVHAENSRSNALIAITFVRRNRPRVHRNDEFACIYLHSCAFTFACICESCSRSTTCPYMCAYAHTYVYTV